MTRRNSPAVLGAVNSVFVGHPDGFVDFEEHLAHHQDLPGHVEVLPLAATTEQLVSQTREGLRNPLTTPREENESGAREIEAEQFAAHIANIVANWSVQEDGALRRAEYGDIMVLVRKRTHLRVYEHALRARHIPFLTSRRGGLLDTLEAEDIQALLTFLITPFADLELAQALRSPLFACSDKDLMSIAGARDNGQGIRGFLEPCTLNLAPESWWTRLQRIAQDSASSPQLQRAAFLLKNWLQFADKLPVHDLLDRIYFEGDLLHRYAAALPVELHETVRANLQAFMEIALNVDAGRYPSLPRFLAELRELRAAENESPDEGKVGEVGNALRIYTVHEAKGLEAPIVWLLDANDTQRKVDSYGVLLDWQPNAPRPAHFSLFSDKKGRGTKRAPYFETDEAYARREEMNLLYVAMTRAKQALLVSGNGEPAETSWYGRIAHVVEPTANPLLAAAGSVVAEQKKSPVNVDAALLRPFPAGKHVLRITPEQQRGTWLHALLQHLTTDSLSYRGITSDLAAVSGQPSRMASSSIRVGVRVIAPRKMLRKPFRIQCRRSNNQFQIRPSWQNLLEVAQQKIDIQRALMRFVDNDCVVILQQRIMVYLGQQDAVGHQFDTGVGRYFVIETYFVADQPAEFGFQLLRDACCHRACRHASGLGMPDYAQHTASQTQAYLRDLSGFARARLATHDDDLMLFDSLSQLFAPCHHRQVGGIFNFGELLHTRQTALCGKR